MTELAIEFSSGFTGDNRRTPLSGMDGFSLREINDVDDAVKSKPVLEGIASAFSFNQTKLNEDIAGMDVLNNLLHNVNKMLNVEGGEGTGALDYENKYYTKFEDILPMIGSAFAFNNSKMSVATYPDENLKKDLLQLKARVEKLERQVTLKPKSPMENFLESFIASTTADPLDTIIVRNCAAVSFAIFGSILGYSIFDKFWLFGGILGFWWACSTVNADSSNGIFTRFVGLKIALVLMYIKDLYKQTIVLWHTGQLAFRFQKIWDYYDNEFQITYNLYNFKQSSTEKIMELNNYYKNLFSDWKNELIKFDADYQISFNFLQFVNQVSDQTTDFLIDAWDAVVWKDSYNYNNKNKVKQKRNIFSDFLRKPPVYEKYLSRVNPWESPFKSIWQTSNPRKSRNKRGVFKSQSMKIFFLFSRKNSG